MDPFEKIFDGQVDPVTIEASGSTFDLKVLFLVHYKFVTARVELVKFGVHSVVPHSTGVTVKGFLWSDRKSDHQTLYFGPGEYSRITRFFISEAAAKKFLFYTRLQGYNIKEDIIKPSRKPLRKIKIEPIESHDTDSK